MPDGLLLVVIASRLLSLVLGAAVVALAYKGFRRSNSKSMIFLAMGLALVTIGAFVEGVLFEFFGLNITLTHAIESTINVLGFLTILYSVRVA